jgi:hypothetical protein
MTVSLLGCGHGDKSADTTPHVPPKKAETEETRKKREVAELQEIIRAQSRPLTAPASNRGPKIMATEGEIAAARKRDERLGKEHTVVGVAHNAFLGAVVRADKLGTLYVTGLAEWPDHLLKKRVSVTGILGRAKLAPDPVVAPDGSVSHGMQGTSMVLNDAQWKLVEAPEETSR